MKKTIRKRRVIAANRLRHDYRFSRLSPQARTVVKHMNETGTITQREALLDHGVQSLTRRITEIRDAGFSVHTVWKNHPVTGQRYARYTFKG